MHCLSRTCQPALSPALSRLRSHPSSVRACLRLLRGSSASLSALASIVTLAQGHLQQCTRIPNPVVDWGSSSKPTAAPARRQGVAARARYSRPRSANTEGGKLLIERSAQITNFNFVRPRQASRAREGYIDRRGPSPYTPYAFFHCSVFGKLCKESVFSFLLARCVRGESVRVAAAPFRNRELLKGRVGVGICMRLYVQDSDDYHGRTTRSLSSSMSTLSPRLTGTAKPSNGLYSTSEPVRVSDVPQNSRLADRNDEHDVLAVNALLVEDPVGEWPLSSIPIADATYDRAQGSPRQGIASQCRAVQTFARAVGRHRLLERHGLRL